MNVRSKLSQMSTLEKNVLLEAQSERVEMTLNTESALTSGLLIQRLTELYEDPIKASVRETVSNALDAVVEAHSGNRPEVRITEPNSLNPVMTIRDNGIGMSYEDLKNVYSKYGASTKIDNLDQIGAYGLGAKAPLSYGTEFTVTSIKKNQKTTIIVAQEEMTNYIKIIDSTITDEPSGTTVSIPVSNKDIDKFSIEIEQYKKYPIEKDVDIYINEILIENTEYEVLTDELLILDGDEKVYSKVWINKEKIAHLTTVNKPIDFVNCLQYVIGGWTYESPNKDRWRQDNYLLIELKAGIVGFNSSRDAIMPNDKYSMLEELVLNYIKSAQFVKDLIKLISNQSFETFQEEVGKIMRRNNDSLYIENNQFNIRQEIPSYMRNRQDPNSNWITRTIELKDLTHEETGFNFNQLLERLPRISQPTAVVKEYKETYYKTRKSAIMRNGLRNRGGFVDSSIARVNQNVEEIIMEEKEGVELEILLTRLIASEYDLSETSSSMNCTFITDICDDDLPKLKSARKTIVDIRNMNENKSSYKSMLIYTKYTQEEIDKVFKIKETERYNIQIKTADDMLEEVKEYRSQRRQTRVARETSETLSTTLRQYRLGNNYNTIIRDISAIDKTKKNVILLCKNIDHVSSTKAKWIINWYSNEHDLIPEEVNLYLSVGNHTINDLNILTELGEIFRHPQTGNAGQSQHYKENYHNKLAKFHAMTNNDTTNGNIMLRLLMSSYRSSGTYRPFMNDFEDKLKKAYEMAEIVKFELPDHPDNFLDSMKSIRTTDFLEMADYNSEWSLHTDAISHLITQLDTDHYSLLENLTAFLVNNKIIPFKNGEYETFYNCMSFRMETKDVKKLYDDKSTPTASNSYMKKQVQAYLEFVAEMINEMSALKF